MFKARMVDQIDVKGRRVFIRVDFNVPIDNRGNISDNARIMKAAPTIKYVLKQGAKSVVLASHLGRPNGQPKKKYTLAQIVKEVEKCIESKVNFLPDCVGPEVEAACADPKPGTVFLLENLRFHVAEKGKGKNSKGKKVKASKKEKAEFRQSLSRLADVYVNDAFGTCHRAHSSMVGVNLPVKAAGFLVKKELYAFDRALYKPERPFVAVLGGKKVHDKLPLIKNLLTLVDEVVISGGMAWTFLKVAGFEISKSIFDKAGAKLVPEIIRVAKENGVRLHLPVDSIAAEKFDENAKTRVVSKEEGIPDGWMGLDVGPKTAQNFSQVIVGARTVVYNGPQGVFEMKPFEKGTFVCLKAMAFATQTNGTCTIVGGGDSASAIKKFGLSSEVTHVSTGGGASLELLQGNVLPGIKYLESAKQLKSKL
mmetsp:Transcript_16475/g.23021  ORF Transcript_16475/g.23021 Transcript_16475/m.23021 type:complete len:423 (-) Transcript_16475:199-1467(-)